MRGALTVACIGLGVGILSACGSAGPDTDGVSTAQPGSVFDGPPKVQVALTVNAFYKAWTAGDGEEACSYLSPRGQNSALEMIPQLHGLTTPVTATNCPDAIAQSAEGVSDPIGQRVSASQVRLEGANRATVQSNFRGAITLRRIRDVWLLEVPLFVD
jgi:hypothetical protein